MNDYNKNYDLVIIGGGPAGLFAAITAKKKGIDNLLLLERENYLGGILNQCIHDGFGLHLFGSSMTGPEYSHRLIEELKTLRVEYKTSSMVVSLTEDRQIEYVNRDGYHTISAKAVILAMGCRERTRYNIEIPGSRPAGVYTAGSAQAMVNLQNMKIGKKAVILGSGDIGLIMARRLALEGIDVVGVYEIMPYPAGLERNIHQCLHDYNIPLELSKTVTKIYGKERLEKVEISQVDENMKPIEGTQEYLECDTLLLSVGLIPENELTRQAGAEISGITGGAVVSSRLETSTPGVFAAGNVLHIHDLADWASEEAGAAANAAVEYISGRSAEGKHKIGYCDNIRYAVPNYILDNETNVKLSFRVKRPMGKSTLEIKDDSGNMLLTRKFISIIPSELTQVTIKKAVTSDIYLNLEERSS